MNCLDCNVKLSKEKYKRCGKCNGLNNKKPIGVERTCLVCKSTFRIFNCYLKRKNGGLFCSKSCRAKNQYPSMKVFIETSQKMTLNQYGKNNHMWKGDMVGYSGIHAWIKSILGYPNKCDNCGKEDLKRYEWANISGLYKRELCDWRRLCKHCHCVETRNRPATAKYLFRNYKTRICQ